jgi:hypothetical protein
MIDEVLSFFDVFSKDPFLLFNKKEVISSRIS